MGRRASARRRGPLRLAHPAEGVALGVAGVLVAATLVAALGGSHPTPRANVSSSSPQASAGAMPSDASSSVQGDRLQALAASLPPLNDPAAAATVGRGVFTRPKASSPLPVTASPASSSGGASAATTPSPTATADPTPSATPDHSATAAPTPTATDSSPSLPSPTATPSATATDPAPSPTLTPSTDAPTSGSTPAAVADPDPDDAASAGVSGGDTSLGGAVVPSDSSSS